MPIEIYLALINRGVPERDASALVCIAKHESNLKPAAINRFNSNGTQDYGLFQINSIWEKPCGLTPAQLLDTKKNLACAVHVYNKQGLKAWVTYPKCQINVVSTVITENTQTEETPHWLVRKSLKAYIWITGTLQITK